MVTLNFDANSGREIMKRRPAFVISRKMFNKHTGFAVIAPITSTIRKMKLEVVLPDKNLTKGSVLIHQMKSLDFKERQIELIEKAEESTIEKVTNLAKVIIM
ncbi:MAG: type II toxin-antitoxin system PemK/MazF family toxin [Pseudomonadales bacterium]|nr:type II toxin-antitoxin system PemK/MazF family toxin [Pseudomonadales bacterium]